MSSGASTGTRRLLPDPVYSILSAPMAESCNWYLTPATKKVAIMGGPCATNCHHNYETVCTIQQDTLMVDKGDSGDVGATFLWHREVALA